MAENVKLIGYRWHKDFEQMVKYNAASQQQLAYLVAQYAGISKEEAKRIASGFSNINEKPDKE